VFGKVFVSLVPRPASRREKLSDVLKSLTESLKWEDELASQTKKLLMYPAFVGLDRGAGWHVLSHDLSRAADDWIHPQHGNRTFRCRRASWSRCELSSSLLWAVLAAPFAIWYGLKLARPVLPAVRVHDRSLQDLLPLVGPILRKIILSRFASSFAMMYASGITVLDAIRSSEEIVGNKPLENARARRPADSRGQEPDCRPSRKRRCFRRCDPRCSRSARHGRARHRAAQCQLLLQPRGQGGHRQLQAMIEPALTLVLGLILGLGDCSPCWGRVRPISKMKY